MPQGSEERRTILAGLNKVSVAKKLVNKLVRELVTGAEIRKVTSFRFVNQTAIKYGTLTLEYTPVPKKTSKDVLKVVKDLVKKTNFPATGVKAVRRGPTDTIDIQFKK